MNRPSLLVAAALALAVGLTGCPPLQTGIIQARLVRRTAEGTLAPVPGARCTLDGDAQQLETDAQGVLRFSGASPGVHLLSCVATIDQSPWGALREVELPGRAGHGGFSDLGEVEVSPIEAPSQVDAAPLLRAARVTWQPPASSGGAPVLGYRLRSVPPTQVLDLPAAQTVTTFSGLADDQTYVLEVSALTAHGEGPAAAAPPITTAGLPGAPLAVRAHPAVEGALLSWWAPDDDGRTPLTGFVLTGSPGALRLEVGPEARAARFEGLTAGVAYQFTVTALNAVGESAASAVTAPVAPLSPAQLGSVSIVPPNAGCLAVDYVLEQAEGRRADLIVEYALDGTGEFRRATQAPGTTGEGHHARAPGNHRFLWNTHRDLGAAEVTVRLRLSAAIDGETGPAVVRELTVQNGADFAAPAGVLAGAAPGRVVVADFNADGIEDLAAITTGPDAIVVLRGTGNGSFQAFPAIPLAAPASALLAGDLDRDGNLDLIAASPSDDSVRVVLGQGDGTFAAPVSVPAGTGAVALALGDVNRDGALDVIAAGVGVTLLMGAGDGSLDAPVSVLNGVTATSVALGDLDGDGKPELVLTTSAPALLRLAGRGDGTFEAAQETTVGAGATALTLADLNGDGRLDAAVALAGGSAISVHLGDGAGGFLPAVQHGLLGVPSGLAVADVDRDGRLDLLASLSSSGEVQLLRGTEAGFSPARTFSAGGAPGALTVADLNRDGRPDLLAVPVSGGTVSWLRGTQALRCGAELAARPQVALPAAGLAAASGDLNDDGRPDVVAGTREGVVVIPGRGDGSFEPPLSLPSLDGQRSAVALADLDGDGLLDLVTLAAKSVSRSLGAGDFTFAAPAQLSAGTSPAALTLAPLEDGGAPAVIVAGPGEVRVFPGGATEPLAIHSTEEALPASVAVADVDGDGRPDLVVAGTSLTILRGGAEHAPMVTPLPAPATGALTVTDLDGDGRPDVAVGGSVLRGRGDGTFFPATGGGEPAIAFADLDADGRMDRLSTSTVSLGDGAGGFVSSGPLGVRADAATVADVDGDGHPDALLLAGERLQTARGAGDGTFPFGEAAPPARATLLFDADRDGRLDLVTLGAGASLRRGLGDGTFDTGVTVPTGAAPVSVASADLNRDGIPDLALAQAAGDVTIALGDGSGQFALAPSARAGAGLSLVLLGDLDLDGVVDLLAVSAASPRVSIFRGLGDGTFAAQTPLVLPAAATAGLLADLDRDGDLDLVLTSAQDGGELWVYPGAAGAAFGAVTVHATVGDPVAVAVGDVDRNGWLEVMTAGTSGNQLFLHPGSPLGLISPLSVGLPFSPGGLAVGELDGDARPEVLVRSAAGDDLLVFRIIGGSALYGAPAGGPAVAVGDVNRDGRPDAVGAAVIFGR